MLQTIDRDSGPFILMFNSPPKTGKDTIGALLAEALKTITDIPIHVDSFARPMREMAMQLFGVKSFEDYNQYKDVPHPLFGGHTMRQWMIEFSESHMKPQYGEDIWGKLLIRDHAHWMNKVPGILILTDLGFNSEKDYVKSQGCPWNMGIVHMERGGLDFSGDSRNWVVDPEFAGVLHLNNDGTPERAVEILINHILYSFHWDLMPKA